MCVSNLTADGCGDLGSTDCVLTASRSLAVTGLDKEVARLTEEAPAEMGVPHGSVQGASSSVLWQGCADCARCSVRHAVLCGPRGSSNGPLWLAEGFQYPAGVSLYIAGHSGDYVYSIRRGLVKLIDVGDAASGRIVHLNKPGDTIGLEVWLDKPYQHTAVACDSADVCRIPLRALDDAANQHRDVYEHLLALWQESAAHAHYWFTHFTVGPVRTRVARLVRLLTDLQSAGPVSSVTLLSGDDMASILGVSTESISRELTQLRQQGILQKLGARSFQCDAAALARVAGGRLGRE